MSSSIKPTILQIIPALEAGGAERAAVDIAAALTKAGYGALVVSSGGRMVKELEKTGAHHITHDVASKNPLVMIANIFWLKGLIAREKIALIHARSRAPAWSAFFAAKLAGIPFVTSFHAAYKGTFFLKRLYNSVMARGDRIIAISQFIAQHIRDKFKTDQKRIVIIPRGIDFSRFDGAAITPEQRKNWRAQWQAGEKTKLIIMPARLSPIKGQELALQALALIKDMDFICVFIGPDQGRVEYRNTLQQLAEKLGLAEKIRMLDHGDMPTAYASCDLVLSPSQVPEGFGRVPVEAQALGAPVIATALGATHETVLDGETGWLVPPKDPKILSAAIRKALSLDAPARVAMAAKAVAHVRARFDLQKMCATTLKVYEDVLKVPGRS